MEEKAKFSMVFDLESKRSDQRALISATQAAREDLEKMMALEGVHHHRTNHDWEVHPEGL